ncbi:serine/threonine-protein kinase [Nocardia sp. NBC_00511]|uniref:serine/threonine-protein kinase n=1 Tax=Nocardia sp. NBC_00511 TaxID=2903591 RepID=UPI0030E29F12
MIAVIARGQLGRVLLGRSPTGKLVAVKQVDQVRAEDQEFRARFLRAVESGRELDGVHTAAVIDADTESESPWLATEYIAGPDLRTTVETAGPLPLPGLKLLASGLAAALIEMHRAVLVHRDLVPGNVVLTPQGPRVIDFGIAGSNAGAEPAVESLAFMSPEQVEGRAVTSAADVFAVGALLAFAATGKTPFPGDFASQVTYRVVNSDPELDGAPPEIRELILSCLEKDPAKRPSPRGLADAAAEIPLDAATAPGGAGWPHPVQDFIASNRADSEWWARTGAQEAGYRDQLARMALRRRRGLVWAAAGVATVVAFGAALEGVSHWSRQDGHAQSLENPNLALSASEARLLDPCAVIDMAVVGKSGTRTADPAWSYAGGCGTTVLESAQHQVYYKLEAGVDAAAVRDTMQPTGAVVGGAEIRRADPVGNSCRSAVVTDAGGEVALQVYAEDDAASADPAQVCASAEHAMAAVVKLLTVDVPLRKTPKSSILRLDPCSVLDSAVAQRVLGVDDGGARSITPHECGMSGTGGTLRVGLVDETSPDKGSPALVSKSLGQYTVYTTAASPDGCDIRYPVRATSGDNAEQVHVSLVGTASGADCAAAEAVLTDVIARLPK